MRCPECESENYVKNSRSSYGFQRYKCKECGRQFTENTAFDKEIIEQNVRLAKDKQRFQDSNRIERKSFREYARLENALVEYNKELIKLFEQHKLHKYTIKHRTDYKDVAAIIQLSDIHANELVSLEHNTYDFSICSKRLEKFAYNIKEFLPLECQNILIAMTGDMMNSDRRLDEMLNMASNRSMAMFTLADILQAFFMDLNSCFNITSVSVSGNESRVGQVMGYSDILATDNYDFTIFNILAKIFEGSEGIHFINGNTIEQVVNIANKNILILHGIDLPANPCEAIHKLKGRYAARGTIVDYVIFGHLHEAMIADLYARSSSLVGANDYSDKKLNLTSRASQNIHIISGNDIHSIKIDLQNTDGYEGYAFKDLGDMYNPKSKMKTMRQTKIMEIVI